MSSTPSTASRPSTVRASATERRDPDAELPAQLAGQVVLRHLIDVQGGGCGVWARAAGRRAAYPYRNRPRNVVRVRQRPIDRGEDGQRLTSLGWAAGRDGCATADGGAWAASAWPGTLLPARVMAAAEARNLRREQRR